MAADLTQAETLALDPFTASDQKIAALIESPEYRDWLACIDQDREAEEAAMAASWDRQREEEERVGNDYGE